MNKGCSRNGSRTRTKYTYDGDGNRLEKSSGNIYWHGAGTEVLEISTSSGASQYEYVFFGGKRIAELNVSTGTVFYYEEDMLGSARTMVQAGQTSVCSDIDFLPFGYEKDVTADCGARPFYKFEGKERDAETGNDDFGARYYTLRLGRWLSADWSSVPAPVPYANLSNPQTLNLYAMVSDDPESFADLDGHCGAEAMSGTLSAKPCNNGGGTPPTTGEGDIGNSGVGALSCDAHPESCESSGEMSAQTSQIAAQEGAKAQHQVTESSIVNKLTVGQIAGIVYNETASLTNSGSQNESIDTARTNVASAIINADVKYGDKRDELAGTAPSAVSSAAMKTDAYKSSLAAAKAAYGGWKAGKDPTGGATHFNMRGNASSGNFRPPGTRAPGFPIKTHSGPFNNSYPTVVLPARGVYVNMYE